MGLFFLYHLSTILRMPYEKELNDQFMSDVDFYVRIKQLQVDCLQRAYEAAYVESWVYSLPDFMKPTARVCAYMTTVYFPTMFWLSPFKFIAWSFVVLFFLLFLYVLHFEVFPKSESNRAEHERAMVKKAEREREMFLAAEAKLEQEIFKAAAAARAREKKGPSFHSFSSSNRPLRARGLFCTSVHGAHLSRFGFRSMFTTTSICSGGKEPRTSDSIFRVLVKRFLMNFFVARTLGTTVSCLYAAVPIRSAGSPAFGSKFEIKTVLDGLDAVFLPQDKSQFILFFSYTVIFYFGLGFATWRSINFGYIDWWRLSAAEIFPVAAELLVPLAFFVYGPINILLKHHAMERATFDAVKIAREARFAEYMAECARIDAELERLQAQILPVSDAMVIALQGLWNCLVVQLPAFVWNHPVHFFIASFLSLLSFWVSYVMLFHVTPRFKQKWAEHKLVRIREAELERNAFLDLEAKQKASKAAAAIKARGTKTNGPSKRGFHSFSCAGRCSRPRYCTFRLIFLKCPITRRNPRCLIFFLGFFGSFFGVRFFRIRVFSFFCLWVVLLLFLVFMRIMVGITIGYGQVSCDSWLRPEDLVSELIF